jgi:hypothetical protein
VRTWLVAPSVGEVEILRDQKSFGRLCRIPDHEVVAADQSLRANGIDIVAEACQHIDQACRQILVQLDGQRLTGVSATGRSS